MHINPSPIQTLTHTLSFCCTKHRAASFSPVFSLSLSPHSDLSQLSYHGYLFTTVSPALSSCMPPILHPPLVAPFLISTLYTLVHKRQEPNISVNDTDSPKTLTRATRVLLAMVMKAVIQDDLEGRRGRSDASNDKPPEIMSAKVGFLFPVSHDVMVHQIKGIFK